MENRTPDVTRRDDDRSPEEIEREMEQTRESITEKVSLLEHQVVGTVHAVTDTAHAVKDAVTAAPTAVSDTVRQTVAAVKDTLAAAPSAVKETVKETVCAVKDTVKETVNSIHVSECVQKNPWAAVGASTGAGFLVGYLFFGDNRGGGLFGRPIMARGDDTPAPAGRVGGASTPHVEAPAHPAAGTRMFGFLDGLFDTVGKQLRDLAETALSSGLATLKQSVSTEVPKVVESTVQRLADQVAHPSPAGAADTGTGTTRVNGPDYAARG